MLLATFTRSLLLRGKWGREDETVSGERACEVLLTLTTEAN